MHVLVRMMNSGVSVAIPTSRTTKISNLKTLIEKKFDVKSENQRLFFAGKQLENQYSLFDYGININDVIQLMVMESVTENNSIKNMPLKAPKNSKDETYIESCSTATSSVIEEDDIEDISVDSKYFKSGDYVDIRDYEYGVWYMGKIVKIKKDNSVENGQTSSDKEEEHDGLIYFVEDAGAPNNTPAEVTLKDIRPYSTENLPFDQLKINDKVLMNYNTEHPKERGYWYDVQVKQIAVNRRNRKVIGDVTLGTNKAVLTNCQLMFLDDILKIKPYKLVAVRTEEDDAIMQTMPTVERARALRCIKCRDNINKLCVDCGCNICGGKDDEEKQILCDECNDGFHITCLSPPLTEIPEDDEWFCPTCKNDENEIVKAGGKLKATKKKTLASTSKRDWGKGMACVGRTKTCNIVPPNHFGAIPGVEVGTTWLFRVQVSESGVHRPPVGGIHGRDNQGAFSIVLSGGYEDDIDKGDEFMYTGSGGRDLSGNKRTALQSCDQQLTRYNRALALNCNVEINDEGGAKAVDWKKGKPVRVVRNYKLRKHSKYAPEVGNRYDGIYKVTKYYPETGKSGFIIWRFVLKRDDPAPAPWTAKGKKRIAQLGLEIIYPENYIPSTGLGNTKLSGSNKKRTLQDTVVDNNETEKHLPKRKDEEKGSKKKAKIPYKLELVAEELIKADAVNKKYWDYCKEFLKDGKKAFLDGVEVTFMCICCQDIVYEPITLKCSHNICKGCLKRSFASKVYQCPSCRAELGKNYLININIKLANTLLYFFPGYIYSRQYFCL